MFDCPPESRTPYLFYHPNGAQNYADKNWNTIDKENGSSPKFTVRENE